MNLDNLTKKNKEFIHIATHQLIKDGKSDEEIKEILQTVIPDILDNQHKGITARSFLGAPTQWAASFSKSKSDTNTTQEIKNTNPWLMWLDTSLVFMGLIALLNGIMTLFDTKTSTVTGITTLLILSFSGGAAIYIMYYYIYRHMGKPKSERPNLIKNTIIVAIAMIVWVLLSTFSQLLPRTINPQVPALLLIVIGAISFGLKFYLQKKYNILSALSPQRPTQN